MHTVRVAWHGIDSTATTNQLLVCVDFSPRFRRDEEGSLIVPQGRQRQRETRDTRLRGREKKTRLVVWSSHTLSTRRGFGGGGECRPPRRGGENSEGKKDPLSDRGGPSCSSLYDINAPAGRAPPSDYPHQEGKK